MALPIDPPRRSRPTSSRLGAIMVAQGGLRAADLRVALQAQGASAVRLGEIVSARGMAPRAAVCAAVAAQSGLALVDLAACPLDPSLDDPAVLAICLKHDMAPFRRDGDAMRFVASDPEAARQGLCALGLPNDPSALARSVVLSDAESIARATAATYPAALARRAATRTPAMLSARHTDKPAQLVWGTLALAGVAAAWLSPAAALATVFAAALALNAMNAVLRIAALHRALRPAPDLRRTVPDGAVSLTDRLPLPRITLLVPLYDEPDSLPVLIDGLTQLDWPVELLDVKLILEADDDRTRAALEALGVPPFCHVLTAPPDGPRTKPKALNHALEFAQGDIVGIYDAEDRPEPDQLRRVAAILRAAGPEVACVQARLSYYNANDNWLTRCFAIEYAIWFDVLLGGYRDLRLPLPLGGTSVFFRREALERLGGWDAHNVTEDADLGMRLARMGYRCEVTSSTTFEEASCRPVQWVRQRSRWLKGYMVTWLTHMRRPLRLWREMGTRGFMGFQAIFMGAFAAYVGMPMFWTFWLCSSLGVGAAWMAQAPAWLLVGVAAVQIAGWGAMLIAALAATARRGQRRLWPWIPTLLLYWPLGAVAAWIALAELAVAPTLWRKTRHGLGAGAADARAQAVDRLTHAATPQPAAKAL